MESEANAVGVFGVVIVRVAVAVHIAEVVGVAPTTSSQDKTTVS